MITGWRGWSVRRRWLVFVLVPAVVLCCGGTAVGAPLVWLARETSEAGKGAPSPDAAADAYLLALGYANEEGLLPVLDDEHQDELLAGWRAYRDEMRATDPPPARLDYGTLDVGSVEGRRATVTADVTAVWWAAGGSGLSYTSTALPWTFSVRDNDGWRVSAVTPPRWCGEYVRPDRCG